MSRTWEDMQRLGPAMGPVVSQTTLQYQQTGPYESRHFQNEALLNVDIFGLPEQLGGSGSFQIPTSAQVNPNVGNLIQQDPAFMEPSGSGSSHGFASASQFDDLGMDLSDLLQADNREVLERGQPAGVSNANLQNGTDADEPPTRRRRRDTSAQREQNKSAQRRFRERAKAQAQEKDAQLAALRQKLSGLELEVTKLTQQNKTLETVLALRTPGPAQPTAQPKPPSQQQQQQQQPQPQLQSPADNSSEKYIGADEVPLNKRQHHPSWADDYQHWATEEKFCGGAGSTGNSDDAPRELRGVLAANHLRRTICGPGELVAGRWTPMTSFGSVTITVCPEGPTTLTERDIRELTPQQVEVFYECYVKCLKGLLERGAENPDSPAADELKAIQLQMCMLFGTIALGNPGAVHRGFFSRVGGPQSCPPRTFLNMDSIQGPNGQATDAQLWRDIVGMLKLTPEQRARLLQNRQSFLLRLGRLRRERAELLAELSSPDLLEAAHTNHRCVGLGGQGPTPGEAAGGPGGQDSHYVRTVRATQRLREVLDLEHFNYALMKGGTFMAVLQPWQHATLVVQAFPSDMDVIAVANCVAEQQGEPSEDTLCTLGAKSQLMTEPLMQQLHDFAQMVGPLNWKALWDEREEKAPVS